MGMQLADKQEFFTEFGIWQGEVNDMLLPWDTSLETGISIIDTQHRLMVDYLNRLHAVVSTKDASRVTNAIDDLIESTFFHFAFEESLMDNHDYRYATAHRELHHMFMENMRHFQKEWRDGKDITQEMLSNYKSWLVAHIKNDDSEYVKVILPRVCKGPLAKTLDRFFGI